MKEHIIRAPATVSPAAKAAMTAPKPTSDPFSSRAPFHFPELGDKVSFSRTPSHRREIGYVRSREFGTRCIEVVDANAKPLRLVPGQYRSDTR
jgi:hypothetical protein